MYPRAYRESVERWSKDHGLDPFMAWAIMRRESAFKPEVTSIADARGLLQLIPPTARSIASVLKINAPEPDELYSPETYIDLGTWYLARRWRRWPAYLLGTPVFLFLLFFFFENVSRLLPANI